MNQKKLIILVSILLALVLIGGGAYYLMTRSAPEEQQQQTVAPVDYGTENPLEKAPDLNPTTKTNPFTKVKTNPFE